MVTIKSMARVVLGVTVMAALVACSPSAPVNVEIPFVAQVGSAAFTCGQRYEGIGLADAAFEPQSLMAYVSEVELITADGQSQAVTLIEDGLWQNASVALLDFEDATGACNGNPATNTVVRGQAPPGDYTGLSFTLGVPESLNHHDATLAPAPLNYTGLFWGWRYGYVFFRLDMETDREHDMPIAEANGHGASGFSVHLGSVGCGDVEAYTLPPEAPCTQPNRARIALDAFDLDTSTVVIDIAALLASTDITVNSADSQSGCMSALDDADCRPVLAHFGIPGYGEPSQQVFSVR